MNVFGIFAYPEKNQCKWQGKVVADGIYYLSAGQDDVYAEKDFPRALFYRNARERDEELRILASQFPNVLFCTGELTSGATFPTSPDMKKFNVSAKGKLPE